MAAREWGRLEQKTYKDLREEEGERLVKDWRKEEEERNPASTARL